MNALSEVIDKLGEKIVPSVAAKVFPFEMYVMRDSFTSDGAGGQVNAGAEATDNAGTIPCSVEPVGGVKGLTGDKVTGRPTYRITFPCFQNEMLIEITSSDRLKVLGRGDRADKTYRVIIAPTEGVVHEAICELEDAL